MRGRDLNPRPPGYEPDELPNCSTPRCACALISRTRKLLYNSFSPKSITFYNFFAGMKKFFVGFACRSVFKLYHAKSRGRAASAAWGRRLIQESSSGERRLLGRLKGSDFKLPPETRGPLPQGRGATAQSAVPPSFSAPPSRPRPGRIAIFCPFSAEKRFPRKALICKGWRGEKSFPAIPLFFAVNPCQEKKNIV